MRFLIIFIVASYFLTSCGSLQENLPDPRQAFYHADERQEESFSDHYSLDHSVHGIHSFGGLKKIPTIIRPDPKFTQNQLLSIANAIRTLNDAAEKEILILGTPEDIPRYSQIYEALADKEFRLALANNWGFTLKPSSVLGTTIWDADSEDRQKIETADIFLNGESFVFDDANTATFDKENNREIVDLESLLLHELGHALGLAHVKFGAEPSIMVPTVYIGEGMTLRNLYPSDIHRLNQIYNLR